MPADTEKHTMQRIQESWEENVPGGGGEGRAIANQVTKSMLPGKEDPGAHLREMSRIPQNLIADTVILTSQGVRSAGVHAIVAKEAPDLFGMNEGERLVTLMQQSSIGADGQSRMELKDVLSSIAKFAARMMRRPFGRGGGMEETSEMGI